MDREDTLELIDLGVASEETQGGIKGEYDVVGLHQPTGLSDD